MAKRFQISSAELPREGPEKEGRKREKFSKPLSFFKRRQGEPDAYLGQKEKMLQQCLEPNSLVTGKLD